MWIGRIVCTNTKNFVFTNPITTLVSMPFLPLCCLPPQVDAGDALKENTSVDYSKESPFWLSIRAVACWTNKTGENTCFEHYQRFHCLAPEFKLYTWHFITASRKRRFDVEQYYEVHSNFFHKKMKDMYRTHTIFHIRRWPKKFKVILFLTETCPNPLYTPFWKIYELSGIVFHFIKLSEWPNQYFTDGHCKMNEILMNTIWTKYDANVLRGIWRQ